MLYLVSTNYGRTPAAPHPVKSPEFPENTWIVSVRPAGAEVFALSYTPPAPTEGSREGRRGGASWRLEPELGMQIDISPRLNGEADIVEAHLARLISRTLDLAHESGRFEHLILIATETMRAHLRRYMDISTRASIIGESGLPAPDGVAGMESRVATCLARRAPPRH